VPVAVSVPVQEGLRQYRISNQSQEIQSFFN
jgi:hypothetical protein